MRHLLFNNVDNVDDASVNYPTPDSLPKGQIGVFDVASGSNLNLTGANATSKMIIAQGVADGRTPVKTNILENSKIENVNVLAYRAPARQITHVGFNGEDGTIEAGSGDYLLKTVDVTNGYEPYPTFNVNYFADGDDTPYDIAKALAKAALGNKRFFVNVEVVVDITTAVSNAGATITVQHGSDVATVSDATGITAGDYIRIGSANDNADPVYEIRGIDGTTITLDRAYAGESGSGLDFGVGDTAPDSNSDAGLKLSGALPALQNEEGIAKYVEDQVTSFRTALSEDFGSTQVRATQSPDFGSGSYMQVSKLEEETQASEGYFYRMTPFQANKPEFFADSDLTYDIVTIQYRTNTTENIAKSNKYLEIVLAVRAGQGSNFEAFFGS
jgi:hypothetical protein